MPSISASFLRALASVTGEGPSTMFWKSGAEGGVKRGRGEGGEGGGRIK